MVNFIDRTFTLLADILLKLLPTNKKEKEAFSYYRAGMVAQGKGRYAEALDNYYEALTLEEDPYDRSYILYNIALICANIGLLNKALRYYHQALELNPNLPQAFHNIGVIYHYLGQRADSLLERDASYISNRLFDKAAEYWRQAYKLAPHNYPEIRNWLKITGRFDEVNIS